MRRELLVCLAVLGWVSGCGSTEVPPNANSSTGSPPATSAGESSAAPRPAPDPPRIFSAGRGVAVGPDDAVVGREYAYSYGESRPGESGAAIRAIDLVTGDQRWRGPIEAEPTGGAVPDGPAATMAIVTGVGGKETLAFTGLRVTPGSGTGQDRQEVVVGMLDAASGAVLWTVRADLPAAFNASDTRVHLAGANDHHVVSAVWDTGNLPLSLVVDVPARAAAWTDQGFLAEGLDDRVIVGLRVDSEYGSTGPLLALDVASRAPVWTSRLKVSDNEPRVVAPGVVEVPASVPFESHTYLLDTRSGKQLADLPDTYRCAFDQRDIIACDSRDTMVALEHPAMRELWRLPDASANRVKPTLHSAFHGLVYTDGQHGPVILDARTGRDAVPDAAIAPDLVVPGFGLVEKDNTLYAHPATG